MAVTMSETLLNQVAHNVWMGKYDAGSKRTELLTAAGYDAAKVQQRVNEFGNGTKTDPYSDKGVVDETGSTESTGSGTKKSKLGKLTNSAKVDYRRITLVLETGSKRNILAMWDHMYNYSSVPKPTDETAHIEGNNVVKDYKIEWQYLTAATEKSQKWQDGGSTTVNWPVQTTSYSTPDYATKVRCRIMAEPLKYKNKEKKEGSDTETESEKNYFTPGWSRWVDFTKFGVVTSAENLQVAKGDLSLLAFPSGRGGASGNRPCVVASWPTTSNAYVDHYEYGWDYFNTATGLWEEASTGNTEKITSTARKKGTAIDVVFFYSTGQEEGKTFPLYNEVRFRVAPVAMEEAENAFKPKEQSKSVEITFPEIDIIALTLTTSNTSNGMDAFWTISGYKDLVASFDVEWQYDNGDYHYFNPNAQQIISGDGIWLPGGTGSVNVGDATDQGWIYSFDPPVLEKQKSSGEVVKIYHKVRLRVKPRATEAGGFVEEWSKWLMYDYDTPTRTVKNLIATIPSTLSPRRIEAKWTIADNKNVSAFSYEFRYKIKGVSTYQSGATGSINYGDSQTHSNDKTDKEKTILYWVAAWEAPQDAIKVEVRVKPEPTVDSAFNGSWTYENVAVPLGKSKLYCKEVSLAVFDATNRTLIARWNDLYKILDSTATTPQQVLDYVAGRGEYNDKAPSHIKPVQNNKYFGGWNVKWSYYYRNTWFDESETNVGVAKQATYNVPEEATKVKVSVEPVPANEDYFTGKPVTKTLNVKPEYVSFSQKDIKVGWDDSVGADRTLYAAYVGDGSDITKLFDNADDEFSKIDDEDATIDLVFEWWYKRKQDDSTGFWYGPDTQTVSVTMSTVYQLSKAYEKAKETAKKKNVDVDTIDITDLPFIGCYYDVPEAARDVRVRAKPDIKNISFDGEWSGWTKMDVAPTKETVKNLEVAIQRSIALQKGLVETTISDRTLVATWDVLIPKAVRQNLKTLNQSKKDLEAALANTKSKRSIISTMKAIDDLDSQIEETRLNAASEKSLKEWLAGYTYEWDYEVDGVWMPGNSGDTETMYCVATYDVPETASAARVRVKPNPVYSRQFEGEFCEWEYFNMPITIVPDVPNAPTLEYRDPADTSTFVAYVDTDDPKTTAIAFRIAQEDDDRNWKEYKQGSVDVNMGRASFAFPVEPGHRYKARARGKLVTDSDYILSETWSPYSSELSAIPLNIVTFNAQAETKTSVLLTWKKRTVGSVTGYDIEYAKKKKYFDTYQSEVQTLSIDEPSQTTAGITGLEASEWFFRIRAKNEAGVSVWSDIKAVTLGEKPDPPTTWSSKTVAKVGEVVTLYWTHNSKDGSKEQQAVLSYQAGSQAYSTFINRQEGLDPDEDEPQKSFALPAFAEECTVEWKVRTRGALPDYSDWSTQRIINYYSQPTVRVELGTRSSWSWDNFNFSDNNIYTATGTRILFDNNEITSYPVLVYIDAGPYTQTPVSYILSITSNSSYDEMDQTGMIRHIRAGEEIFKRYYNTSNRTFMTMLTPDIVSFENGVSYTLKVILAMSTGLTAETTTRFSVSMEEEEYEIDASTSIDSNAYTVSITPYVHDLVGIDQTEIVMSVFRREFDGTYTKIADNSPAYRRLTYTDPHPALDYARYRIIARSLTSGAIKYYDLPGIYIGYYGIIIQWDEQWQSYDDFNDTGFMGSDADPPYSGSMVKLPYNVSISESNTTDTENVEYIGRKHPVSYYGTQVGQSASWTAEIPKTDKDTIYALRRLAVYMGNAYVREPNGSGYWAHVEVSFQINYDNLVVPVNINVTRVEGGM